MPEPRWIDTPATVRAEAPLEGGPRIIEGIAVPYGVAWESAGGFREMFAPGAFAADAERWNMRSDGARLPFLSDHIGRKFLGGVAQLIDTPEALLFRAELRDTPDAAEYIEQVEAGANGVSVEFAPIGKSQKSRDGTVRHGVARIAAIAGALTPAYDAARVAAREENVMPADQLELRANETPEPTPEPEPTPQPEPPSQHTELATQRRDLEAARVRQTAPQLRVTRPEAIYTPRSEHGFLNDAWRASQGDSQARERQDRHYALLIDTVDEILERAGDVLSSEIAGAYPSEYMPGLLVERILKGRPMASFYNRFPISDARPRIYPKVTTSTTVSVQSAEGVNPAASDFATTPVTITPLFYGGETSVARQVLDGADPAAEAMIIQDLTEAYSQTSETAVKTVVEAGSTDLGVTLTAATPHDGIVDMIVQHQASRFLPAERVFLSPTLYGNALKETDTAGRLLMPWAGPSNAAGEQGSGASGGSVLGVPVAMSWTSTDGVAGVGSVAIAGRASDFIIYESPIFRFTFDQGAGAPAAIRVGLWAYLAAGARRGSLKETAA
jgi:HK97 family phage prohead protease/HK97 family phage major capsid protein